MKDHIQHVKQVLKRLRQRRVKLKIAKCNFARTEINCLGFKIEEQCVTPGTEKVQSVQLMEAPRTIRQMTSL